MRGCPTNFYARQAGHGHQQRNIVLAAASHLKLSMVDVDALYMEDKRVIRRDVWGAPCLAEGQVWRDGHLSLFSSTDASHTLLEAFCTLRLALVIASAKLEDIRLALVPRALEHLP